VNKKRGQALQAVRTAFTCPSSDQKLQAKGSCTRGRSGIQGASCGPSCDYVESSSQCRQIIEDEQLVAQLINDDENDSMLNSTQK
jgi:hypothetical protein